MDDQNATQVRYSAVWRPGLGNGAQWTTAATDWNSFITQAYQYFNNGLRIVSLGTVALLDNVQSGTMKAVFSATWRDGQGNGALYAIAPSYYPGYVNTV